MGMAASQARYLALVARKSNCEFEGQQINQSRLNLANQSANLFNQMLGLKVPVPPSTQDFTKTQYSYKDGNNGVVIDSWKQLSKADPDYNYVVKSHYFTDVYTGSLKKMSDPQVQLSNPTVPIASLADIQTAYENMANAKAVMDAKYSNWQQVKKVEEAKIAKLKANAQEALKNKNISSDIIGVDTTLPGIEYSFEVSPTELYNVYKGTGAAGAATNADGKIILDELYNLVDLGVMSLDDVNAKLMAQDPSFPLISDISELKYDNTALTVKQANILETFGLTRKNDGTADTGDIYISTLKDAADIAAIPPSSSVKCSLSGYPIYENGSADPLTEEYLDPISISQTLIDNAADAYYNPGPPPTGAKVDYEAAKAVYDDLGRPSYIGNCPLTYLDTLTDDQNTELQQVVRDMIAQGIDTDIVNCFDSTGNYLGGVYSFQLNGVTYYTTYNNLVDAYASNQYSNNDIDAQYKMPYYNASFISTRIEQEQRALLETDGEGRFTSIRYENDSVTYVLNMETITDDAAYEDAMNKYYYENAMYDKTVQDINAKTSLIHQQDQQLELRLKQLDTEQNALKTEMDAVQKIVKDNVDNTFKTFNS